MKPTDFSHNPLRFRFSDPTGSSDQTIGWSFVENLENLKPQLERTDVCQIRHGSKRNTSSGLCRSNATETEHHEVFEDPYKSESVVPWTSWKDCGLSCRLPRSRSLIRTNPWISSSGESPPRSPADVEQFRSWSAVETGMSSLGSSSSNPHSTPTTLENEAPALTSLRFYRREDSQLTTSMESDSLYQSMTSDTDAATSLMSGSDVNLPEVFKDERSRDVISGGASKGVETERPIRHKAANQSRELKEKNSYDGEFETPQTRSKENKIRGRPGPSGFSFNLQLKRPSFGGKRFSEIADEYEARTAKWPSSSKSGTTMQQAPPVHRGKYISASRGDGFAERLKARPSTNIQKEIETDREENDIPTYDAQFSCSVQFRKKMMAVRSSLQDKVAMLRREKRMVDEKIREAKEEERIRLLQLDKFRRQLSNTRKEILLRTIEELKRSLGEQSQKLQTLYDIVLLEQRQMLCCQ